MSMRGVNIVFGEAIRGAGASEENFAGWEGNGAVAEGVAGVGGCGGGRGGEAAAGC